MSFYNALRDIYNQKITLKHKLHVHCRRKTTRVRLRDVKEHGKV